MVFRCWASQKKKKKKEYNGHYIFLPVMSFFSFFSNKKQLSFL